jgi:SCP-2 sterol transfer family
MAEFPRAEWFAELVGRGAAPGPSADVQLVVSAGADGDVSAHIRLVDGVVAAAGLGAVASPDVTLTAAAPDAAAIAAGGLDPSVAFMQGRMKTAGDPGCVLELLAYVRARTPRS